MSIRKRPVQLTDSFESTDLGTYDAKPNFDGPPKPNITKAHTRNLDIFQCLEVMAVLLRDYQSKHIHIEGSDEFHVWFPFSWVPLELGDEIKNLSTNEVYKVVEIITTRDNLENYVRLQGKVAPKSWNILRLDDKNNKTIKIIPAYPDTDVKPYEFDSNGHVRDEEGTVTWVDVITYQVVREAPGSRDRHPFGTNQELSLQFREEIDGVEIKGQMIDTEIRFDFWTRSNERSERMRIWFRDFTHKYTWLMKHNGVGQFFWWLSFTSPKATRSRPGIVHRSASYFFRTEYSVSEELFTIRDVELKVLVPASSASPETSEQLNINI